MIGDPTRLHWLIQSNGIAQDDYTDFAAALAAEGSSWSSIKVQPFSGEILRLPNDHKERPIVAFGSTTLCRVGRDKQWWKPGVWWNDNFTFEVQRPIFKKALLNYEGVVSRFDEVAPFTGDRFIRPVDDGKIFAGMVVGRDHFASWQQRCIDMETDCNGSTQVLVAPLQPIFREYRFFVVDKCIVTGSTCWEGDRVMKRPIDMMINEDLMATEYCRVAARHWQPDRVFVMDIALLEDGSNRIIEINCANGSGFYASDKRAFIRAVEKMPR